MDGTFYSELIFMNHFLVLSKSTAALKNPDSLTLKKMEIW